MDRKEISELIRNKLVKDKAMLRNAWLESRPVRHFICDDLLPPSLVKTAHERFPDKSLLIFRDDMRERKYAGSDTSSFHTIINDILFAFQDKAILTLMEEITGLSAIEADPTLYASGVSIMEPRGFLNPHIDNSHDGKTGNYRILNALFYVTPDWQPSEGGNLELWDKPKSGKVDVPALFNRLVIMQTDRVSWHSVSAIVGNRKRCCISNYYFSPQSPIEKNYRHVTLFKARPEQGLKRILFQLDGVIRNALGKIISNQGLLKLRNANFILGRKEKLP